MLYGLVLFWTMGQVCSITTTGTNQTASILYDLANYAVDSRQNLANRYQYEPQRFKYPPYYQKRPLGPPAQLGQYGPQFGYLQNFPAPNFAYPAPGPYYQQLGPRPESVMDVLYSIARNDKLRCVPRLLCEVTSDTISRSRQSFSLPSLPVNINMESIIGILSTIDATSGSPIITFAKAALLGYSSKGNSDSCVSAYPRCPRDPDRLVQYLNNYNGGFFRFFNGINPPRPSYPGSLGSSPYVNNLVIAEQRIQNKPVQYVPNNYVGGGEGIVFPANDIGGGSNLNNRPPKTLTFPNDDLEGGLNWFALRKPKELPFSISHYYSNELDFQRPLPNHRATPMIFPDRTGTGDLRLDADELNENYKQPLYNPQNNGFVNFNRAQPDDQFYGRFTTVIDNGRDNRLSFPV